MSQQDEAFFKNFTMVMVVLALIAIIIFLVAQFVSLPVTANDAEFQQEAIAERLKPIGNVKTMAEAAAEAETETASAEPLSGEQVYNQACAACHGAGIAGAPKQGDSEQWAARIEQGKDTLYNHAINGFQGAAGVMPAKGGQAQLSDEEVKAGVDYMIAAVTGESADSAAPAAEEAATTEEAPAEAAPAEASAEGAGDVDLAQGETIYNQACVVCHGAGIAGAPKLDDSEAWAPRLEQGMETMVNHAINGFQGATGVMPAKGGQVQLSDAEVKNAVAYMVEQAK